ncbi:MULTISPECIES: acetoacetate--CoA ligase [unclassified Aminobacter]|uniref:acetoacetate--CoA ligase n=1 Tax=unclassified Aminobacter TaxID=2644704 RepID=UPI000463148D|nr:MULTISPECIES: acetoacetate--CoA ligase [unclassified Aminobacter]TWG49301.1 acetoacetyl-CoA synthetase [Aminobacter sp. J44]TWH23351.1 acetoacetyl-CoA synthetase [Aminobacter sp. J15]
MLKEGDFLWEGSDAFKQSTGVADFLRWLREKRGLDFANYGELQTWSAKEIEAFWAAIYDYFEVMSDTPYETVLAKREMPGAQWFVGARVNYAEHILRHEADDPEKVVVHHLSEIRPLAGMKWRELGDMVRKIATRLRAMGVVPGDRVVSYMPNIPETMAAMLAVTAIGAIWSSAAPEFGVGTVADRFSQIGPKVLFAADGYRFAGKDFWRRAEVSGIVDGLPSLEQVVWLDYLTDEPAPAFEGKSVTRFAELLEGPAISREEFRYERVAHDHPLWILFSSGTTGLPKAIVQSHIGIILEHYKSAVFHLNLKASSRMFFYSTTGWVMWNSLMWGPLVGGSAVLYDGSPTHPGPDLLWQLAADTKTTSFGASPTFVENMRKHGIVPKERFDLSAIESIMLSGSPATPESFKWLYDAVKEDLWVTSQSGGTEFCCGLVGATPTQPVYAGEIQARCLGIDVRVFDDAGNELIDEVGELVVCSPMPSMPLFFWNDPDFKRYKEAYFDTYPGIWRHGDFMKINSRGGCFVYGRSDSTLNRFGVRIGSAEIYRTLEGMAEIEDSLIVCIEEPGGGFYMPLFVQLKEGVVFDEALDKAIRQRLRAERSPRHVPDEVHAVPMTPYTLTGKKMEVPVRKLLMGWPVEKAYSPDAMRDPKAMDWFVDFARRRLAAKGETMYGALAKASN